MKREAMQYWKFRNEKFKNTKVMERIRVSQSKIGLDTRIRKS